jgi:hypothetical protein
MVHGRRAAVIFTMRRRQIATSPGEGRADYTFGAWRLGRLGGGSRASRSPSAERINDMFTNRSGVGVARVAMFTVALTAGAIAARALTGKPIHNAWAGNRSFPPPRWTR